MRKQYYKGNQTDQTDQAQIILLLLLLLFMLQLPIQHGRTKVTKAQPKQQQQHNDHLIFERVKDYYSLTYMLLHIGNTACTEHRSSFEWQWINEKCSDTLFYYFPNIFKAIFSFVDHINVSCEIKSAL